MNPTRRKVISQLLLPQSKVLKAPRTFSASIALVISLLISLPLVSCKKNKVEEDDPYAGMAALRTQVMKDSKKSKRNRRTKKGKFSKFNKGKAQE